MRSAVREADARGGERRQCERAAAVPPHGVLAAAPKLTSSPSYVRLYRPSARESRRESATRCQLRSLRVRWGESVKGGVVRARLRTCHEASTEMSNSSGDNILSCWFILSVCGWFDTRGVRNRQNQPRTWVSGCTLRVLASHPSIHIIRRLLGYLGH